MANQHHPSKQAVTYWLPRELVARLRAEAKQRNTTQPAIVIAALEQYLPPAQDADDREALRHKIRERYQPLTQEDR